MGQRKAPTVRLRISVTGRHPRFFRKQVQKPAEPIPAGSLVFVRDKTGKPVGTGFYNSRSTLALRLVDHGKQPVGPEVVGKLLDAAIDLRERTLKLGARGDAYRLVHGEGDGMPGLTIDRLGQTIVAELSIKGLEAFMERIGERLLERYPSSHLVLRVPKDAAEREGIDISVSPRAAPTWLSENRIHYQVTPGAGHKTGFFCDQRDNRARLGRLARGRRVLDVCCNGAGFAMHAAKNGAARVRAIDLDENILEVAKANVRRNHLSIDLAHIDAFDELRALTPGQVDCIVLDPPSWVDSKADYERGAARYRDLNRLAMQALAPGGLLFTFCCSGLVQAEAFLHLVRDAAAQARRDARILELTGPGPDHPIALECPETRYLSGILLELR